MFGLPVVIALYLALLLLPIPYWTLSSAAQPQHRSTSRPSSSGNGGSSSGVQVHTNRRPQPHQQHRHWVTRVTRWELRWRSRDWYWEVPNARLLLVVSFRAALCILPPLSVGVLRPAPHLLPLNGYLQWPIFVQYAWRGWVGFLQLVGIQAGGYTDPQCMHVSWHGVSDELVTDRAWCHAAGGGAVADNSGLLAGP
jgi:hypothetical protein